MWLRLVIGFVQFGIISTIQTYQMDGLCGEEVDMRREAINQGQITLHVKEAYTLMAAARYDLTYCSTTIKSGDNKVMFYLESFDLPCHIGYLDVYDGSPTYYTTRIAGLQKVCGHHVSGTVFTSSSTFITVNYTARQPQDTDTNAFKLVFTSYRTGLCPSTRHLCDNGRCISADLICNGFRSCGDGSMHCPAAVSPAAMVGIILGSIIMICVAVTMSILITICRRRQIRRNSEIFTTRQSKGIVNPMFNDA